VTAENAVRFLAHQAAWCRQLDEHEAFCLLLPGLMRALGLSTMGDEEALAFRSELKSTLENQQSKKEPRNTRGQ
jgi:hypothetical protein